MIPSFPRGRGYPYFRIELIEYELNPLTIGI
jgi:hypothetical protein